MYQNKEIDKIFLPILIKKDGNTDPTFKNILEDHPDAIILDLFSSQKKELFKIKNPKKRLSSEELNSLYNDWQVDKDTDTEGIWVYYPWSKRLIHILDKDEFIQLRTSRNQYKISPEEQLSLFDKQIGIIGLSVGHAVAISIATERICGKLKLADFDTIELSNLNRLKTGIHNIGLNKCIVTAREIAEIDPFLEIECYQEGITNGNMANFLTSSGKLDILIDECDDLEIKIFCREMAKEMKIPVVMETSDRGMLDVERFDLDNNRPILHGFLDGIPPEKFKNISPQDRLPLTLKIIDIMKGSNRGRASLLEVGQTITTWPQLASAVTLGGGVVTDVCRRILLNQFTDSGRYYVDLEELIGNKVRLVSTTTPVNLGAAFEYKHAIRIADSLPYTTTAAISPTDEDIRQIVDAGSHAPSSGNDQPWKWLFKNGRLHLFHDRFRSFSFANHNNMAANIGLGAAYENVVLKSKQLGFNVKSELFPLGLQSDLSAVIDFSAKEDTDSDVVFAPDLVDQIYTRSTNRNKGLPVSLSTSEYTTLQNAAESVAGAKLHYITDKEKIMEFGKVIGECDLIMMLNPHGHHDFFERDIKWTDDENKNSNDGINASALGNAPAQLAALAMMRDKKIAETLRKIGGGNLLVDNTQQSVNNSSCLALLTVPESTQKNFFLGGMAVQRLWLRAEQLGFAIQPMLSPLFLFSRLSSSGGLLSDEIDKLEDLRRRFRSITNLGENLSEIFLFRISKAGENTMHTKRLPLNEILLMVNDKI